MIRTYMYFTYTILLLLSVLERGVRANENHVKQFKFDPNDKDGLAVQAFAFCALHLEGEGIDRCVDIVTEKVYTQAPHLRPKDVKTDSDENGENKSVECGNDEPQSDEGETRLDFALLPGENPYEKTEAFCKKKVLLKDIEWCKEQLLKQIFSQAPDLKRRFDTSVGSTKGGGTRKTKKAAKKMSGKSRPQNIARGRPVVASSDDGGFAEAVVDGCKSVDECLVTWTSDHHVAKARLSLDFRDDVFCIRAVRVFWGGQSTSGAVTVSTSGQIASARNSENIILKRRNLPATPDRVDRFKCSGGHHTLRREFLHVDFSEKQGEDFDVVELQVFGTKGPCRDDDDSDGVKKRMSSNITPKKNETYENVLVVIAYDRPKYLRQVLETLRMCEDVEKFLVHIFIDPSPRLSAVEAVARNFSATIEKSTVAVTVHPHHTGPHENIRRAVETAFRFSGATFTVVLEDDVILSRDALRFMLHAKQSYAEDKSVFSVTGYADNCHFEGCVIDSVLEKKLSRRRHFTPWFWGTWRDRWEEIVAAGWTGWDVEMNFPLTHDRNINNAVLDRGFRGSRTEVFPLLSRANNIGFEGGFHANVYTPDEMKRLQYIHCWAAECGNANDRLTALSSSAGPDVAFSEMRGLMEAAKSHRVSFSRVG